MKQKRTSAKTKELAYKGTVQNYFKTKQRPYKRGDVASYAYSLIKQKAKGDLNVSDKELAEMVIKKFGGATSIKAIQYYRHKMRQEGLIEKARPRVEKTFAPELTYEIISPNDDILVLSDKQLITFVKKLLIKDGASGPTAKETTYSIEASIATLINLGYEVIEQNNFS